MKKFYLFLSTALITVTSAFSQVRVDSIKNNVLIIGNAKPDKIAIQIASDVRFIQQNHQLALISAKDLVSTYYYIYSVDNKLLTKGYFQKRYAGEYMLIDLGEFAQTNYFVIFSSNKNTIVRTVTKK